MESLLKFVQTINSYLSDYVLITLLVGAGLYFTIRTRFVQVRCFWQSVRYLCGTFSLHGGKQKKGLSPFQALSAAVAAQVGTGNLVGVSGAILAGGPGAIFWMWIVAFLGMSTIYAEAILAQETRVVEPNGVIHGGPVYYIHKAFPNLFGKIAAVFFAVAVIISLGFIGTMVQANSIAETCHVAFGLPGWSLGVFLAILSALVFIGGTSRIGAVTEKLVPGMAVLYLVGGLVLLLWRIEYIPETVRMIFYYAFNPEAIIGGSFGAALKIAISQGVKRGLFSNEAGMGSTPHAHAQANVADPHDQGLMAMIGVFIDTFVVLNMTALVVISTLYAGNGILASGAAEGVTKTNMVQHAFATLVGNQWGNGFVAACLFFFAFSTILSWNFFGKINAHYLLGKKGVAVYSVISVVFIFLGSCLSNDLVWELQDMFNQLMVLPNVIALIALAGLVAAVAKKH